MPPEGSDLIFDHRQNAADRVERRRHGRTGALGMWPVGSRELCRPGTEAEGTLVTESDLSLRAPAQVAA
jgi:hypothetical protein